MIDGPLARLSREDGFYPTEDSSLVTGKETIYEPKIGVTVARCVLDVVAGRKRLEEVLAIISGSQSGNVDQWRRVIGSYNETVWEDVPEAGDIFWRLYNEGRIIQPGLDPQTGRHYTLSKGHMLWVSPGNIYDWLTVFREVSEGYAEFVRKHVDELSRRGK